MMRKIQMRRVMAAAAGCYLASVGLARADGPSSEQLYILPPSGWVVAFHETRGNIDVTELLPPGQTLKQWTEMLSVQMVTGQPVKTPQDALKEQAEIIDKACDDIGVGPVNLGVENGYETALRAMACPKSKQWGDGELSLYKVISGKNRLYMIWRSWRGPAFEKSKLPVPEDTTKAWLAFMSQVMLCDAQDPAHQCPQPPSAKGTAKP